jgi:hypothetical protein
VRRYRTRWPTIFSSGAKVSLSSSSKLAPPTMTAFPPLLLVQQLMASSVKSCCASTTPVLPFRSTSVPVAPATIRLPLAEEVIHCTALHNLTATLFGMSKVA